MPRSGDAGEGLPSSGMAARGKAQTKSTTQAATCKEAGGLQPHVVSGLLLNSDIAFA